MVFAVRVEKRHAEEVRKILLEGGKQDRKRRIVKSGDYVEIPVISNERFNLEKYNAEVIRQKNPVYCKPRLSAGWMKDALSNILGEEEAKYLKGRWEIIGNILIIELPEKLEDKRHAIGKRLLRIFPRIKTVLNRRGILDAYRRPVAEVIAGTETETIHKENYCSFKLDPTKVMFSAGNIEERRRMAFISREEEVVLDMFAGIGQFTIPLAKHSKPKKVFSIEKNPRAFGYLKENIKLNKLKNVEPILGDCREVSPKDIADRVIMGYFLNACDFLPVGIKALRDGKGVIHYHDLAMKKEISNKAKELKETIEGLGYSADILKKRIVKSYAPMIWHIVLDVSISKKL
jgi:tRNA wybutosine-synthesizing protein 2